MIQKIRKFIVLGITGLLLLSPGLALPLVGGVASATIQDSLCSGADDAAGTSNTCDQTNGGADASGGLKTIAQNITKYFSIIVGAISIIMIIYGGFRYIISGGDSGKVGSAKNTLIYAIVGLIIVALAQLIVRFVITQANSNSAAF